MASTKKADSGAKPQAARRTAEPKSTVVDKKRRQGQKLEALAEVEEGEGTADDVWTLRLYVAGDSPKSRAALTNLQRLCDTYLEGKYEIEVIDLKTRPELAKADQIVALPTLVRRIPEPMKRLIGDLSNPQRALVALELDSLGKSTKHRHLD